MAKWCSHRDEYGQDAYKPSKRGAFEVCEKCGDRFPCAKKNCAHYDCQQVRHPEFFRCFYCEKKLEGAMYDTWTTVNVRNYTVTGHYCCRDASNTTSRAELVSRARGKDGYYPEPCSHEFEGKEPMSDSLLRQLANAPMVAEVVAAPEPTTEPAVQEVE